MKRKILIGVSIIAVLFIAATTYPIRGILQVIYGGDELTISHSADSTKFVTNNSRFKFNKPIYANGVLLGSGGTITSDSLNFGSDVLQWDRTNKKYKAYAYSESLELGKIYKSGNNLYARGMSFQRYGEVHINNVAGTAFFAYGGEADLNAAKFGAPGSDSITIHKSGYIRQYVGGVLKTEIRNGYIHQSWGADVTAASTITPTGPMFKVTGSTTINTINLPYTGFSGAIEIVTVNAADFGSSGNIQQAVTTSSNKVYRFVYNPTDSKWYVSN